MLTLLLNNLKIGLVFVLPVALASTVIITALIPKLVIVITRLK